MISVGQRFTTSDIVAMLYPNSKSWERTGHMNDVFSTLIRDRELHFVKVFSSPGKTTIWERIA